jgi:RNA polymerase sigma-70 factor (ECF subfamily)
MARTAASRKRTPFNPGAIIERHQAVVWRYLRALGCDPATAEDLTQETFLKVLQRPFDDYDPLATAAYLRRVAHNLFISLQRRAGRVVLVEDIQQFDIAWTQWIGETSGEEFVEALRACFERLSARAKWALEMRFRDDKPRAEIAALLKITEHGAKNLMQRAKQQLRGCVERKINASA